MTLLENIYQHLQHNGLVNNREHFSTHYLGKSKNWYAVQTHERRDFSISAAIECLRKMQLVISQRKSEKAITTPLIRKAQQLEQYIQNHLSVHSFTLD